MIAALKTKVAQMTVVDDTLTEHGIGGKFEGDSVSIRIEDLARLIIQLQVKALK